MKRNPKKFYGYIRSLQTDKTRVARIRKKDGTVTTSDQETADVLCEHFEEVFVKEERYIIGEKPDEEVNGKKPENGRKFDVEEDTMKQVGSCSTSTGEKPYDEVNGEKPGNGVKFDVDIVAGKLKKLQPGKSPGPDGIHPMLLKNCTDEIAKSLSVIFKWSYEQGELPGEWKQAHITSIYKKGDKSEAGNYRPVSLTSVVCKVMESIIKDHMISTLEKTGRMTRYQHGFTKGRSCLTNLLETFEAWTRLLDAGIGIDVIYLDYRKAFDTVPQRRLLIKLQKLGIEGRLLKWIEAFLSSRQMRILVNGYGSRWAEVLSGVPQGSVLGPLLFLVFVNDLPDWVHNSIRMFADDTKIWAEIRTAEDGDSLQRDLDKLVEWSNLWLLKFNTSKCKVMHIAHNFETSYNIQQDKLDKTVEERDLGIITSATMKVSAQCSKAATKAMQILRLIRRHFGQIDREEFRILYKSFVRPHLEYCVQAWSPFLVKDIQCLEQVQKRATKMVEGLKDVDYENRLKIIGLQSLENRRIRGDLIEAYKIITGKEKVEVSDFFKLNEVSHDLRGHMYKLAVERSRLEVRKHFFSQRVVRHWNRLPATVVEATSINSFKTKLDKWLKI